MAMLLRLKTQTEADEKVIIKKDEQIAELQSKIAEFDQERILLNNRQKEMQAAIQLLQNESSTFRTKLNASQEKIKQLTSENNLLVNRLLEIKNKQVEELNDMNALVGRMMRTSIDRTAEMKAEAKKSAEDEKYELMTTEELLSVPDHDPLPFSMGGRIVVPNEPKRKFVGHNGQATCVAYDNSSTILLTAGVDSYVKLWDSRTGMAKAVLRGATQTLMSCCVSPDNKMVFATSSDKNAYVWELQTMTLQHTLTGHSNKVYAGIFADNKHVISGSHDRTWRVWNLETGYCTRQVLCFSACNAMTLSPNGNTLATAHIDNHIRLWSLRTGELMIDLAELHLQQATSVDFSYDGNLIITNSKDNTLKLVDVRDFRVVREFSSPKYKNAINWNRASFSPDAKYIMAGSNSGAICVWNTDTGRLEKSTVAAESSHIKPITSSTWNRSGSQIATCDTDGVVVLWD
eukprot:TRINITY_DN433_c0_g1_i1.p1 TRINITY_DN433_c0_g1~~TRINITY_DN433_c0_g1_i1.p1  ORF type:complete len:460 (-),score=46.96 TRINITY_DN433_c0_g1_i1:31-1410(-)